MDLSFLQILWFILIVVLWIGYVTLRRLRLRHRHAPAHSSKE